jgi:excisionase family DNA binding protein
MPKQSNDLPPVLTVEETARFLRIGRSAAYELVRTNTIPSIRLGKLIRIPRDTLLSWLASGGLAGTKE